MCSLDRRSRFISRGSASMRSTTPAVRLAPRLRSLRRPLSALQGRSTPFGLLLLVLAFLSVLSASVAADDPPTPNDRVVRTQSRWNLLELRDPAGAVSTIDDAETWGERRQLIVAAAESVMGPFERASVTGSSRVLLKSRESLGSVVRFELLIEIEPSDELPVTVHLPTRFAGNVMPSDDVIDVARLFRAEAPRLPLALALHPTDDHLGRLTIVRSTDESPTLGYAFEMAERGWLTVAPAYPRLADYRPDLDRLGYRSGTMKSIRNGSRLLDLLIGTGHVDEERIAAIGHSLGGHSSVYVAVFDERIDAVVSCCGLDAFVDYYRGDRSVWQLGRGWCTDRYMPRLVDYADDLEAIPFDFPELIGALAPRPVLIIAPLRDDNFRADSVDRIADSARPVYSLFGAAERLEVRHPDEAHDFSPDMRRAAYEWLDRQLSD